jgi:hypothetical protein
MALQNIVVQKIKKGNSRHFFVFFLSFFTYQAEIFCPVHPARQLLLYEVQPNLQSKIKLANV